MRIGQCLRHNDIHIDMERLKAFKSAGQIFAIWLDDEYIDKPFDNTIRAIDFFNKEIDNNSDIIRLCKHKSDFNDEDKRIKAVLSIEGGEAIEGSCDKLRLFYDMGVRLMTITWNRVNELGCGALSGMDDGLTDIGISVVKQMNELGMLVDVSHLNEAGFKDVCRVSERPFIATHSNAYSVCKHPRNLNDYQLSCMAERECVAGINIYPPFVDEDNEGRLDNILRHIDYMADRIGENNVVLGCDFDGIDVTPKDLTDVSKMQLLYDRVETSYGAIFAENLFYNNIVTFLTKHI
jgi:membrane dipeptidase